MDWQTIEPPTMVAATHRHAADLAVVDPQRAAELLVLYHAAQTEADAFALGFLIERERQAAIAQLERGESPSD